MTGSARVLLAGVVLMTTPAAAYAQDQVTTNRTTEYRTVEQDDDAEFPWGLLGLFGLAGLLGRKRKDADIHVDARRGNRP